MKARMLKFGKILIVCLATIYIFFSSIMLTEIDTSIQADNNGLSKDNQTHYQAKF